MMLDRDSPGPPKPRSATRRAQQARYQRTYRRRQREGAKLVEVTPAVVLLLLETHHLSDAEANDPSAIGRALDAMAKEWARLGGVSKIMR
jgi:hypothetical protein